MKKLLIAAALLAAGLTGYAFAQIYTPPIVATVGTSDLFQDVIGGVSGPGFQGATAAQIAGVPGYTNLGVITTGNTYTFGNSTTNIIAQPSGTLAAVTLTAAANPSDGQNECFTSTQTTTALTWNANTGQSISGAPSAGVANTQACMVYVKSAATWYRLR